MSQQGGRPTGHEDDWWGQLYDDSAEDTGPTPAADSLDDRFASAAGTLGRIPGAAETAEQATDEVPDDGARGWTEDRTEDWTEDWAEEWTGEWAAHPTEYSVPPVPSEHSVPPEDLIPPEDSLPFGESVRLGESAPPEDRPPSPSPAVPAPRAGLPADAPIDRPPEGSGTRADVRAVEEAGAPPDADWWQRAPWEPPPAASPGPMTFPPGPRASEPADHPRSATPPTVALAVAHVGSGPPTYDAEPTALPAADPDELDDLVPDTVLDGARYGACTLRAVSIRGDSPRYRGEPRRDALLTARFGSGEKALVLVAMATGARATPRAHHAAAEACQRIARAVGRSHARLVEDIRAARRGELKSGLHRLTDRSLGRLRADAVEQGIELEEYAATLRCLLLPADPGCRARVFFGVGTGGLFRLRDGEWQDIEPPATDEPPQQSLSPSPSRSQSQPPHEPFRFRASIARPGDTLLMCTGGLAEPLRGEAELCAYLAGRWSAPAPPGLAAFLADAQVRVKGYADDRTAAAVWEA